MQRQIYFFALLSGRWKFQGTRCNSMHFDCGGYTRLQDFPLGLRLRRGFSHHQTDQNHNRKGTAKPDNLAILQRRWLPANRTSCGAKTQIMAAMGAGKQSGSFHGAISLSIFFWSKGGALAKTKPRHELSHLRFPILLKRVRQCDGPTFYNKTLADSI